MDSGGARLVSIITPVYNKERYLTQTVDSILAQTWANWELWLMDDGSTDGSTALCRRYEAQDGRIHYRRLARNSGAAAARNEGLRLAAGNYVAFLDADDLWLPEKLERQMVLMSDREKAFTFTAIEMIDENGLPRRGKRPVPACVDYRFLLSNTVIACSSVVIDRARAGAFTMPDVRKGQDFATWLSLLRGGAKAYGINEALVRYRVAPGAVSSNKLGALARTWHIYRTVERLPLLPAAWHFTRYAWNAAKKYWL